MYHSDGSYFVEGSAVLVEITNSGRAARGERWDFTSYKSKIEMCRPGELPFDMSLQQVPLQPSAATDDVGDDGVNSDDGDDVPLSRTCWAEQEKFGTFFRESTDLTQASRGTANWGSDLAGVYRDSFGTVGGYRYLLLSFFNLPKKKDVGESQTD